MVDGTLDMHADWDVHMTILNNMSAQCCSKAFVVPKHAVWLTEFPIMDEDNPGLIPNYLDTLH